MKDFIAKVGAADPCSANEVDKDSISHKVRELVELLTEKPEWKDFISEGRQLFIQITLPLYSSSHLVVIFICLCAYQET